MKKLTEIEKQILAVDAKFDRLLAELTDKFYADEHKFAELVDIIGLAYSAKEVPFFPESDKDVASSLLFLGLYTLLSHLRNRDE